MRLLVIGFGSMGRRHARNARELGWEVAVYDSHSDAIDRALTENFGEFVIHQRWNVVSVAIPSIDAVIISTPAATHYEVANSLRRGGYAGPLFVEKPLDITTQHADFWSNWPDITTASGYNWRFMDRIRSTRSHVDHPLSVHLETRTNMNGWPGKDYASAILECSHDLDLAQWILGPLSLAGILRTEPNEASVLLTGCGPTNLHLDARWHLATASDTQTRSLEIEGVELTSSCTHVFPVHQEILEESYKAELAAFLEAAEKGEPVPGAATFQEGLSVVGLANEIEGAL